MRPKLGKRKWWEERREERHVDKTHYKNWCVIEVMHYSIDHVKGFYLKKTVYKPCAKLNVPVFYDLDTNKPKPQAPVSDHLTKHEAYAVAKLLNTTQGELL